MTNDEHDYNRDFVSNLIDNSIISDSYPPKILLTTKFFASMRARVFCQCINV